MTCDVSRCQDSAYVLVTFVHNQRPVPYCRYHAFRSGGTPRWKQEHIRLIQKVGSTE